MSDHAAFYGYRWLAWATAGLAFMLPGQGSFSIPRDVGLLVMLLLVNVALTGLAESYVRVVRRRPGLLALDLLFGWALLWLNPGATLPYLPYALGALLLPALMFGVRGAMLGSLAFVALDFGGIALFAGDAGADLPGLAARAIAPFAFAFCWVAVGQLLPRAETAAQIQRRSPPGEAPARHGRGPAGEADEGAVLRLGERPPPDHLSQRGAANLGVAAPAALARAASSTHTDPSRRLIYELTPGPEVALPAALEQLAARVGQRGGLALRVALVGAVQPLNPAQHSVLLRVAQEALLNIQQHARARAAQLTLTFEPRAVTLVVQDDGVGLLDGTYERPGLHALRAVRYRLAELDGQLSVFEGESGGVTVRATLPLE